MQARGGVQAGPWARRARSAALHPRIAFRDLLEERPTGILLPIVLLSVLGISAMQALSADEGSLATAAFSVLIGVPLHLLLLAVLTAASWLMARAFGTPATWGRLLLAHACSFMPAVAFALLLPLLIVPVLLLAWAGIEPEPAFGVLALCVVGVTIGFHVAFLAEAHAVSLGRAVLIGASGVATIVLAVLTAILLAIAVSGVEGIPALAGTIAAATACLAGLLGALAILACLVAAWRSA